MEACSFLHVKPLAELKAMDVGYAEMALKLAGVGWNELELVWRGYIFGYKKPVLGFSGESWIA